MFYIYLTSLKYFVKCVLLISSINVILDTQSGVGIYGKITLPTDNEQVSVSMLTKPIKNTATNNYESLEQSKQLQDLIARLSAAFMKSFTNALLSKTSKNIPRQFEYLKYPYPTYYPTPLNNFHKQEEIADHPLLYRPFVPQPLSFNYIPSYNEMYGRNKNYWWLPIPQQYNSYGLAGEMQSVVPPYVYSENPVQESQNLFDYGVSAGVYARTYGNNRVISTSDRDYENSFNSTYGGYLPWPLSFGNNGQNTNLNNSKNSNFAEIPRTGIKNIIGSGSVVQIPISEATGVITNNAES